MAIETYTRSRQSRYFARIEGVRSDAEASLARPRSYSVWSLKSGARFVSFEHRLQLEAFVYLTSFDSCESIIERPILDNGHFPRWFQHCVHIGTRNHSGACRFYTVIDGYLPHQVDLPGTWAEIHAEANKRGLPIECIRARDLANHQVLVENWLRFLPLVREAELDPDFELQTEICEWAQHPSGVSVNSLADGCPSLNKAYLRAQVAWLIHECQLQTDFSSDPFSDDTLVFRTRSH